ncbi:pilin [Gilvimarinus sp. DA14]|nr:pilin [Gilvimarinus sp. DA14]
MQSDVGVFLANEGSLGISSAAATAAGDLEGKYVSGVSVAEGTGIITVNFGSGALSSQSMTLTPYENTAGGQIAYWECTGLTNASHLPSTCAP